jgi:hypothetical protein
LAFVLFLPFMLLCCASTAKAVPIVITGGSGGTAEGRGNFGMNLTGANFSFGGFDGSAPKTQLCGLCQPGTRFGGSFRAVVTFSTGASYNGTSYGPSGYVVTSGGNFFTVPTITIPLDLSPVSVPFTFVGGVSVFPTASAPPGFSPLHFELTGSGIATFTFTAGFGSSVRSQATFVFFAPPEPVPEPATMLLLATGLAGAAAAKVRRRRPKQ